MELSDRLTSFIASLHHTNSDKYMLLHNEGGGITGRLDKDLLAYENDDVVDMGLPSGTLWATKNLGAVNETDDGMYFSWGNVVSHKPKSDNTFADDWGGVNGSSPYYDGQVYGSTPGCALTGNIPVTAEYDAARAILGAPWRMPSNADFGELFTSAFTKYIDADGTEVDSSKTDKLVTVNGVVGIYLQSVITGARLFFPCAGSGNGTSRSFRGFSGYYWSSTWGSAREARNLMFYSGGIYPQDYYNRYLGFTIRPVRSV